MRPWPVFSDLSRRSARVDMSWVLASAVVTFALSCAFNWQERLTTLSAGLERWQLDELPFTLIVLALGLAWYARRRHAEAGHLLSSNRELAQQLIAVQERERLALARELHDELAQHCTAIRVEAAYLRRSNDLEQAAASAQRAAATAEHLHRSLRGILRRLRPAELDELGPW